MYTYCRKFVNSVFLKEHGEDYTKIKEHNWEYFVEKEIKDAKYTTIQGKSLMRLTKRNFKEAMDDITVNSRSLNVYGARNFGYQYIRDKFRNKPPLTPDKLYIANIDIETGRDDMGYSSPEEARCPITSITLHNIHEDTYTVWGFKEEGYRPTKDNVRYIDCDDEEYLLNSFVNFWSTRYPDIVTGWNTDLYDIPYIINRIHNIMDNSGKMVGRLSPFNYILEGSQKTAWGKEFQTYDMVGITSLDYLTLFKKFTYITPENYKLDTVAHLILNERKIDYSEYANLQDLYDRDYTLFIDYNIKDTTIVARLDEKLKLFDLVLSVAYKAGINYADVISPVNTWDILIYNSLMDKNMVPPLDNDTSGEGRFIGAYVKEPIPGMYKWVMSFDLNSLYPHCMMGTNISPDKLVFNNSLPPELIELRESLGEVEQGIQRLVKERIDTSALKKYDVSLTPNGQFYKRDSDGFIPGMLEDLYRERKAVKRSMLDDKQSLEDCDSDSDKDALITVISQKNTLQMALKILMNSLYGALGTKYFRYYDLRLAESVTSVGQLAIIWVADRVNAMMNRILCTDDVDYIIAIDTDSLYLNTEAVVSKFIKTDDTEKIVDILDGWSKTVMLPEIEKMYDELAEYTNAHKQKMVMAREVIADRGFWTRKKRYALNVYDNEGVRYTKPKTKIMGLECVRSSVPEFCRNRIKESIVDILTTDENTVQDLIIDTREEFYKQPIEDIAFPRGVNNIEKWVGADKLPKKSCPIHVRGCIVYNNYLESIGSTDERIHSGDKIKFVYLRKPNLFKSNILSFPPSVDSKIYKELQQCVDYEKQYLGTFFDPVDSMLKCVGWSAERVIKVFDFC